MTEQQEPPREEDPMTDTGLVEDRGLVDPVAVGPGDPASNGYDVPAGAGGGETSDGAAGVPVHADAQAAPPPPEPDGADASLLALIDRLAAVLERGDLGELEVSSGGTTVILRAPSAIERPVAVAAAAPAGEAHGPAAPAVPGDTPGRSADTPPPAARPSVKAPLTGIYYGAPSPGALPYVSVGDHVSVGQIIGLIEAMKLFNEIKSDLAGRVVRICADNGALVKAKQPLIEVEPA